jgi:PKD repeat protein
MTMKKILFTLLTGLLMSLATMAQNYTVTVFGNVMIVVNNTVTPVADQAVIIHIDSLSNGGSYQGTVYTDESGYYEDVIALPGYSDYAFVQTMTFDSCMGQYQYNYQTILPGQQLQPMDFYLCNYTPPDCQASFYFYQLDPADNLTYAFVNTSIGDYTDVYWSFGDSTFSSEANPVHTYLGEGTYSVCLTISNGSGCSSTYCDYIYIGTGYYGCENSFYYAYNEPFTLTFDGFMLNGQQAQFYSWDFGDGTYGQGQTVTHTYTPQGVSMYMVGLSTMVMDSTGDSCFYTSYQEVWMDNSTGCSAYFTYYPDSLNQQTIQFIDMSYTSNQTPPSTWLWEFGDGTSSALQNPLHTYADSGYYMVCLTIADSMGMCTSNYCEEVFTGYPPPPSGCESFIMPIGMSGFTVDFQGYTISTYETQYSWDFGDGASGTGQYISHTYPAAGMYNVSLNTIDATGCTFQTFTQIWLDSTNTGGCSAWYSYVPVDSTTFTFTGFLSVNGGNYPDSTATYAWDFGDGTSGTGMVVTHYFQENPAGSYTVCLTATTILADGSTCTSYYCDIITLTTPAFNIFGHVLLENNISADQALVHLMTMDTLWQGVVEVQTTGLDSGGYYNFYDVPMYNTRMYYVQAELTQNSAYYGQYVPTYHLDAMNWESALPILPFENWPADVLMIASSPVDGGSGTITGIVTNLGARGTMNNVEVVLMDSQSNPVSYVRSDDQGSFSFENLPFNTYIIHAEMMGIHTTQASITLSEQNPVESVEVQVSGTEANVVFGVPERNISLDKVGDIFPNPVNGNAQVEITVKKPADLQITIISQVMDVASLAVEAGTVNYRIETASLPVGLYLLKVSTSQGEMVSRKFMKIQ